MKPIHRDDLPPEVIEEIQAMFPGYKIVCTGDAPNGSLPPHIAELLATVEESHKQSIINGTCLDCGLAMTEYTPGDDDWEPANGWKCFTQGEGDEECVVAWQCPACDAAEYGH